MALFDGRILADPSNAEVGEALGVQTKPGGGCYDVTVIGAGPAGLAAAVYGASEGLATVVLEPEAIGGQAGTSSLIRNYLGFPPGSAAATSPAGRTSRPGTSERSTCTATRPPACGRGSELVVTWPTAARCGRAVVIATGVAYRRLGIPALEALVGAGVFYGAAATEAPATRGSEVFVVGGRTRPGRRRCTWPGTPAGDAAGPGTSLADSMSDYLIREIDGRPTSTSATGSRWSAAPGGRLECLTLGRSPARPRPWTRRRCSS